MAASQAKVVVFSIHRDMLVMTLGQFFNGSFDVFHPSRLTHGLRGVIGVATRTVPVTLERLGVEGHLDTPLLGDTDEEVTGHPEVITHRDTLARPNLELPLSRHNFSVNTADVNTRIETRSVVSLDEITGEDFSSSYSEGEISTD